ncbi:hypothetical protein ZWY2020_012396 [Hordeum vulgare]|nr:hypothetical protein ZWY2020_012396 [Hordeum vulgare]
MTIRSLILRVNSGGVAPTVTRPGWTDASAPLILREGTKVDAKKFDACLEDSGSSGEPLNISGPVPATVSLEPLEKRRAASDMLVLQNDL